VFDLEQEAPRIIDQAALNLSMPLVARLSRRVAIVAKTPGIGDGNFP
jgi:hypothetical protein